MKVGTTRYRWVVLLVLCSLAFLTYLDRICIMRVQNDISTDLRFDQLTAGDQRRLRELGLENDSSAVAKAARDRATERMGWIFAAFAAGYLLFEVPGGWLGDRSGARRVIFRIVLCWSIFTAATGGVKGITRLFTSDPTPEEWFITLVIVRFLFGACEAGAYPNIARALARWFPYRERATAQSFIWFSSRIGGAFAPTAIGSLMLVSGSWERAFYLLGVAGVIWAVLFYAWFRDRPEDKSGVSPAEVALIRGDTPSPTGIHSVSTGVRIPWKALFSPNVLALCVVSFAVSFCFYFYITFLPRYLKDQFQVDYQNSQILTGLPLFLGAFGCVAGGLLSDLAIRKSGSKRWGRSLIPAIAWTSAALCVFAVPLFSSATMVMALLVIGFVLQDLGVASMWSLPADLGGRFTATLGGWMNTAGCVAALLSPLTSAKMSIAYGWNSMFYIFGATYLLGALAWLRVDASAALVHSTSDRN